MLIQEIIQEVLNGIIGIVEAIGFIILGLTYKERSDYEEFQQWKKNNKGK